MRHHAFWERARFFWPCVAHASILNNDICVEENEQASFSLREEVSCEGVFYLSIIKYVSTDLYLARVASDPASLAESNTLAYFTEEQLLYTLPWDIRIQHKAADEIIPAIYAHVAACRPVYWLDPDVLTVEQHVQPEQDVFERAGHSLSENIELTHDELRTAMQEVVIEQREDACQVGASPTKATHLLQQALLQAALDTLMRQLWKTPGQARSAKMQARCKLLAFLRHWQERTRQRVVSVVPRWCEIQRQVVFGLLIALPIHASSAIGSF